MWAQYWKLERVLDPMELESQGLGSCLMWVLACDWGRQEEHTWALVSSSALLFYLCVCVPSAMVCKWRSEDYLQSFFSATWALGLVLRSSGLAASTFTCWAVSLAQTTKEKKTLKKDLHFLNVCVLCACLVPVGHRRGYWIPQNWGSNGCELPYMCWETSLGLLQDSKSPYSLHHLSSLGFEAVSHVA